MAVETIHGNEGEDEIVSSLPFRVSKQTCLSLTGLCGLCIAGAALLGLTLGEKSNGLGLASKGSSMATEGQVVNYEDVVGFFHGKKWLDLEDKLCPSGVPNADLGETLFALGRSQLGISEEVFSQLQAERNSLAEGHENKEIVYRFFHGEFQNITFFTNWENGHTFGYIPIWKAANKEIRGWLDANFNQPLVTGDFEETSLADITARYQQDFAKNTDHKPCLVTAIRDPISHFLSGYREIERRREKVVASLNSHKNLPMYLQMPVDSNRQRQARFAQFVSDILTEDSKELKSPVIQHICSMSRVLEELHNDRASLTSYLPSLDNLQDNFPKHLLETCSDAIPTGQVLEAMGSGQGHHTPHEDEEGFYESAKESFSASGTVAKALCAIHAIDYACWKDLPEGIPLICQEVYASNDFFQAVMSA